MEKMKVIPVNVPWMISPSYEKDICPDSKMYEVQNSVLKESLNITDNLIKHWLIIGHEEEIHILSKGFVWKEMP